MSTLYISPTKSGTGDGSSWANAASLSDLSSMIAKAGAGGTVLLRADQGAYHTTGEISIIHGGVDGSPVKIMGVDGAGNPMNADIIGTRDEVVTTTSATGSEVFRLLDGANNLSFEHLSFVNQGNGCFRVGADIRNLSIEHVDADNVMRFVENYVSGTGTSATVDGLTVRDVEVHGFSRGAIRLQYDSHNVVLENIKGDSERQNGDSWATGVALEGTVHDVVIRDVTMSNSFDDSTSYWNGDGFTGEGDTYNITFENTLASDNTDGGYDIKSDNVTLINAVATGNGRNFRFWGDNVTMIDCTSTDPHEQGGTASQVHVWLGDGATVTIIGSTITDTDPNTRAAFDISQGNATLNVQETTVSLHPTVAYVKYGTNSVLNEIADPTPGSDSIESSITFSLSGHTAHNLTLTGSSKVDGFGNDLANVITGNTGDNVLQGGAGDDTLIGGAGNDTASYVDSSAAVTVSLALTATQNTRGAGVDGLDGIENVVGSTYSDVLTGNSGANHLSGGGGNDTLDGGLGNDVLAGGAGNDCYFVNATTDSMIEWRGEGIDEIRSTVTYSLAALVNVENLTLLGTGAINATGNALNNVLTGNGGDNFLNGGAAADTMPGGLGNDTYSVDAVGDVVMEAANAGTDTVRSWISYTLGDNVENLTLVGSANISATGNALNNVLTGNGGDNFLNGGAAADTMAGGFGNDTYSADAVGDVVTEAANAGTDTVRSWISYTLGYNLENLTLAGSANISATGNALNNVLTGNGGNNFLNGGAGADTMAGGFGNDTYSADAVGDVVTEATNAGTDTVRSWISYTLGDNLENLTLVGLANISATGNALNNVLTGNGAANALAGDAGSDTLVGGDGNDTLVGGGGDDQIDVSAGNDTVRYTAGLDGSDVINGFDGDTAGGQDVLNLDALFDSLGIPAASRAGHLSVDAHATSVDVRFDADSNGSFESVIATLNTTDAITAGADIIVGT